MICLLCHQPLYLKHGICYQCIKLLPTIANPCLMCGLPNSRIAPQICSQCQSTPSVWDVLIAATDYKQPLPSLIYQFKSQPKAELHFSLARLLFLAWYAKRGQYGIPKPDIVTCIPLHPHRYRQRGFNQAALLAKLIAKWLQRPFLPTLLWRTELGLSQKNLSKQQRHHNSHGLFACDTPLSDQSIAVIDDIVTTGYTMQEACYQLQHQGTKHIQILCLSRTIL